MQATTKTSPKYRPLLDLGSTERAIEFVKTHFPQQLAQRLHLQKVSAPMLVQHGTGINDDLNGTERPVSVHATGIESGKKLEIVHSLAKWKRLRLQQLGIPHGSGLYTDMRALRPDEILSNIHSICVDQWDWEKHISRQERTLDFLKQTVEQIYEAMRSTEAALAAQFPALSPQLPEKITFIHTEELVQRYPSLTSKEREHEIAKQYGAVFLIGIGGKLSSGEKHDGRAPDYDDWSSQNEAGFKGLNGDILVWNSVLQTSFELSSMGIRVDKEALLRQLELEGELKRTDLFFHQLLLQDAIPQSIGGGIGQSRFCMFLLQKLHIGEVQASVWSASMIAEYQQLGAVLL